MRTVWTTTSNTQFIMFERVGEKVMRDGQNITRKESLDVHKK